MNTSMNGYDPDEWARNSEGTVEPYLGKVDEEEEAAFRKFQEERRAAHRAKRLNPTPEQAAAQREFAKNLRVALPPMDPKPRTD